jgi:hypothetical protein
MSLRTEWGGKYLGYLADAQFTGQYHFFKSSLFLFSEAQPKNALITPPQIRKQMQNF